MKSKRTLGLIIFVIGVVLIGIAQYIYSEVAEGRVQIASGEKTVKQGRKLFSVSPVSKEVGDAAFFNPADKKIAAGKMQADEYENLADVLQVAGIAGIIVGGALFLYSFKKKK